MLLLQHGPLLQVVGSLRKSTLFQMRSFAQCSRQLTELPASGLCQVQGLLGFQERARRKCELPLPSQSLTSELVHSVVATATVKEEHPRRNLSVLEQRREVLAVSAEGRCSCSPRAETSGSSALNLMALSQSQRCPYDFRC